ncbi:UNVERIFIED_CONTAM: hypothetical protein Scaly_0088400 [Sesamum calycinum]|uniref:G-patch domain-containing protein n=1 Tax=Sesamum calycinum TaxID=2727403 RepID=A0AAW2SVD1_9LAMI
MQAREYPFLDSDVPRIFDDLLKANLIDLLEMKQPEEVKRKDDPKYCKYHHLVGHAIQDCFVFKDKVMQLACQGKISLEEDFTTKNAITIESRHVDGNKDSCNAMHGDNITNNEDTLFEKEDSSDVDDCMSIITFTDEDLLLGSKPHNRPLFVAGYELEIPIDELSNSRLMIQSFNQGGQSVVGIIRMQLTMRTCNRLSHHSRDLCSQTQEKEGRHEALAIDEKGYDPKAFKLLIKGGYDPKEKLSLGKLPRKATGKKLHGLNATQIMLKEKGHAVQDSRVGLSFTPAKPIRIAIKRVNSNYVSKGFSLTEDHKREENLSEFVFKNLAPQKRIAQNSQQTIRL